MEEIRSTLSIWVKGFKKVAILHDEVECESHSLINVATPQQFRLDFVEVAKVDGINTYIAPIHLLTKANKM